MSIHAAGKKHKIPEATLWHKLSGYQGIESKPGPRPLLTEQEEQVLVNYINNSCQRHCDKIQYHQCYEYHFRGRSGPRDSSEETTILQRNCA